MKAGWGKPQLIITVRTERFHCLSIKEKSEICIGMYKVENSIGGYRDDDDDDDEDEDENEDDYGEVMTMMRMRMRMIMVR